MEGWAILESASSILRQTEVLEIGYVMGILRDAEQFGH